MHRQFSVRAGLIANLTVAIGAFAFALDAYCATKGDDLPPPLPPGQAISSGGAIEESYYYHRQSSARLANAARGVEPARDWYGYGFPVSTYRWGWFGAAHYYPVVWWHEGYYGDCCRHAYRRGY